jgi:hypothetical protein
MKSRDSALAPNTQRVTSHTAHRPHPHAPSNAASGTKPQPRGHLLLTVIVSTGQRHLLFGLFTLICLMSKCGNRPACCKVATAMEREGAMALSQPLRARYHPVHHATPDPEMWMTESAN